MFCFLVPIAVVTCTEVVEELVLFFLDVFASQKEAEENWKALLGMQT